MDHRKRLRARPRRQAAVLPKVYDVIVLGAGAAGLFCALHAGRKGQSVLLLDHAKRAGEKIRISGGGRCNFTNHKATTSDYYLTHQPEACQRVLARFTPNDFLAWMHAHAIAWEEREEQQCFAKHSATDILDALLDDVAKASVRLQLACSVNDVQKTKAGFCLQTSHGRLQAKALVVATGGLSIPKMGATKFGFQLARQFQLPVYETRAGLVPLRFTDVMQTHFSALSGLSLPMRVRIGKVSIRGAVLLTHRGLSGPAILQISNHWREGQTLHVDLLPEQDLHKVLAKRLKTAPRLSWLQLLSAFLPKRFARWFLDYQEMPEYVKDSSEHERQAFICTVHDWVLKPSGSEGYRKAEVTLGGVDLAAIDTETMQVKTVEGLYFIGEVVDVTGYLGGYNFQWAWASAWVAAQALGQNRT